jgi:hypothetical protein
LLRRSLNVRRHCSDTDQATHFQRDQGSRRCVGLAAMHIATRVELAPTASLEGLRQAASTGAALLVGTLTAAAGSAATGVTASSQAHHPQNLQEVPFSSDPLHNTPAIVTILDALPLPGFPDVSPAGSVALAGKSADAWQASALFHVQSPLPLPCHNVRSSRGHRFVCLFSVAPSLSQPLSHMELAARPRTSTTATQAPSMRSSACPLR